MNDVDIKVINNNMEKYENYKTFMDKYNLAMKNEFYFETIFISYAMLEDRFKSFLCHIKAINSNSSSFLDVSETRSLLAKIYFEYGFRNYHGNYSIDEIDLEKISVKKRLIQAILKWSKHTKYLKEKNDYLDKLKNLMFLFDYDEVMYNLNSMNKWVDFRNKIIHDLMNKNCYSVNKLLKEKADIGLSYSRYVHKMVTKAKNFDF